MPEFEVESVLEARGRTYILARRLSDVDFELSDSSVLGGCPIERWLEVPRAVDPSTREPRADLFAFALKTASDRERFVPGSRVVLRELG